MPAAFTLNSAPLTLYGASGSPYVWRVMLALAHQGLQYKMRWLSFSNGELRTPEFLQLNPRGKVPVLRHADFIVRESQAIIDYLDATFVDKPRLLPTDPRLKAQCRQLLQEVDNYLAACHRRIMVNVFFRTQDQANETELEEAVDGALHDFGLFASQLQGPFLLGELTAADFALYPYTALVQRYELRRPDLDLSARLGAELKAWMGRIEALPYFQATVPPHWKL